MTEARCSADAAGEAAGEAAGAAAGGGGQAAGSESGARDGTSLTAEEAAQLWEYWDDHGRVQGPFSAAKLLGWLRAGHLTLTLNPNPG